MKADRTVLDVLYRTQFGAFVHKAFEAVNPGQRLHPNWHIEAVCHQIQRMAQGESDRRLVLNQPPRSLKSFIVSVSLPAWLLGRDPGMRIICASYGEDLAFKFSRDCRALIESPFYKRVFRTRLSPRKATEAEFETTRRGSRLATSVGGTLTGRGGTVLIVDDPLKANEANSELARAGVIDWFRNTALSRLDTPAESLVIATMQRLHVDDLAGVLIEQGWRKLVLPALATEPASYALSDDETYHRPAGELLQLGRDSMEALEAFRRDAGSRVFAAQYQQDPTPPDGDMIKEAWLGRYDAPCKREEYQRVILTCDPAGKAGPRNDYTALAVVGIQEKALHVLHAARGHWTVMQMIERITALASDWGVDLVIIEDTASGMGLIQLLKEKSSLDVIGRTPVGDKETRLLRHQGRFEAGRILLPLEAPWLAEFESELLAFPGGRYDDQVDALLLALDWYAENQRHLDSLGDIQIFTLWRPSPWRMGGDDDSDGI
jgi:predicted phage terminase large subunit-like protein